MLISLVLILSKLTSAQASFAQYHFDEGEGTIIHDATGNAHNGTIINMPESNWGDGYLSFRGIDNLVPGFDNVEFEDDAFDLNEGTWATLFWIDEYPDSVDGAIMSKDADSYSDGGRLYIDHTNNKLKFLILSSYLSISSNSAIPLNEPIWVAVTFGADGMHMYLNTVEQVDINPDPTGMLTSIGNLRAGAGQYVWYAPGDYEIPFKGYIDEIEIYDYQCNPNIPIPQVQDSIVIWHFDEGDGNIAYNATGSVHNGTLINMTDDNWHLGLVGEHCLQFGGADSAITGCELVEFEDDAFDLENGTWALMFKTSSFHNGILMSKDADGYLAAGILRLHEDGRISFGFGTETQYVIYSNNSVSLNEPIWIAVNWGESGLHMFIDMVEQNDFHSFSGGMENSYGNVRVGAGQYSLSAPGFYENPFNGYIDEVTIYNYQCNPSNPPNQKICLKDKTILDSIFLSPASPNPFNPSTTLSYSLPASGEIALTVYDLQGREVSTLFEGYQAAGNHQAVFDGAQLASGIYFAVLQAGEFRQTQKLALIK